MTRRHIPWYAVIAAPLFVSALLAHELGHFLVGWGTSGVPPEFHLTHVVTRAPVGSQIGWVWFSAAGDLAVVVWWLVNYLAARRWGMWGLGLVAATLIETCALLIWLLYCAVSPLGWWQDSSDQAEFLRYSGIHAGLAMLMVVAMAALIWRVSWPVARQQLEKGNLPP